MTFIWQSQTASGVPFDNSTNGFTAVQVQAAIEEVLNSAINNDRYPIGCAYGGNARAGRYLEPFSGLDFLDAPFVVPEYSKFVTVTVRTQNTGGDFIIGFFKTADLVNPLFTITLPNGDDAQTFLIGPSNIFVTKDDEIVVRVTSGSRLKPSVRFWLQTQTITP